MKAFVLTGEGAKGAWQAAALNRLDDSEPRPDLYLGVSSGALNSFGASCLPPKGLANLWCNIKSMRDVFSFNWTTAAWSTGLFNSKPAEKMLRSLAGRRIHTKFMIPAAAADTGLVRWMNYDRGRHVVGGHIKAVIAAISIPGLVEATNGFIDAGISVLAPVSKAIEMGATDITVIMGRPYGSPPTFNRLGPFGGKFLRSATYGYRFLDVAMHQLIMNDIPTNVRIVCPREAIGDSLQFNRCREMADLDRYPMQIIEGRSS